jgi:hypothetical protein
MSDFNELANSLHLLSALNSAGTFAINFLAYSYTFLKNDVFADIFKHFYLSENFGICENQSK